MSDANLLLLVAVVLPPRALTVLGTVVTERTLETPYGSVGALALRGGAGSPPVWVLPYSGLPSRTDPRATISAARELGVHYVLNWDEGISINPLWHRGQSVIPMDYIDGTRHQPTTFDQERGGSAVARTSPTPPFSPAMTDALQRALPAAPAALYLGIDGPRRETAAEARMYRSWQVDVIGHNLVPEVALANESGLSYAGLVTVVAHSADQGAAVPHGELREALEKMSQLLPQIVLALQGHE